jgi:RNA-dependent RNA polymerase
VKEQIYKSGRILGQLYDAVERVDFIPNLEMSFDNRILNCGIEVSEDLMQFAKRLKDEYDSAMSRIMAQHEIKTEFEVWSTFVLSHAKESKDYKFHEEIGGISSSLRDRFRKTCYDKVGSQKFERLAPLAVAMYKITAQEVEVCLSEYRQKHPPDSRLFHQEKPEMKDLPFISLPWIFPDILGKIAMSHYDQQKDELPVIYRHKAGTAVVGRSFSLGSERNIETAAGVQQFGSILELFQNNPAAKGENGEGHNNPDSIEKTTAESGSNREDSTKPANGLPSSISPTPSQVANNPISGSNKCESQDLRGDSRAAQGDNIWERNHGTHEGEGKVSSSSVMLNIKEETINIMEKDGDVKTNALDMLADLIDYSFEDVLETPVVVQHS